MPYRFHVIPVRNTSPFRTVMRFEDVELLSLGVDKFLLKSAVFATRRGVLRSRSLPRVLSEAGHARDRHEADARSKSCI